MGESASHFRLDAASVSFGKVDALDRVSISIDPFAVSITTTGAAPVADAPDWL